MEGFRRGSMSATAVPEQRAARRALERAIGDGGGWGVAQPTVAEFWSVVTHPAASGLDPLD